jgi:hypothetical protein
VVTGGEGSGGGEAVRRWRGWCGFASGERGGSGESRSEWVDRGEKGKAGFTLGKEYSAKMLYSPLTPLRLRLRAESIKIGASEDFLRTSEARSLQGFSRSFRKIKFQRQLANTPL